MTQAGLAQVAFGQTQAFHLWTWIERTAFNREVPGSSPGVGIRVYSLVRKSSAEAG